MKLKTIFLLGMLVNATLQAQSNPPLKNPTVYEAWLYSTESASFNGGPGKGSWISNNNGSYIDYFPVGWAPPPNEPSELVIRAIEFCDTFAHTHVNWIPNQYNLGTQSNGGFGLSGDGWLGDSDVFPAVVYNLNGCPRHVGPYYLGIRCPWPDSCPGSHDLSVSSGPIYNNGRSYPPVIPPPERVFMNFIQTTSAYAGGTRYPQFAQSSAHGYGLWHIVVGVGYVPIESAQARSIQRSVSTKSLSDPSIADFLNFSGRPQVFGITHFPVRESITLDSSLSLTEREGYSGVDVLELTIEEEGFLIAKYSEISASGTDPHTGINVDDLDFEIPGDTFQIWDITYSGSLVANSPIQLAFRFNDLDLTILEEPQLDIYHFADDQWTALDGVVDVDANTITVFTPNLSPFALGFKAPEVVDSDGDGVVDGDDNCMLVPNLNQEDVDEDAVGDACDNCLMRSNHNQIDGNSNDTGDACEIIEDLSARAKSGKVNLTWTPIPDAVEYDIYRSLDANGPYELIANHITDYAIYADYEVINGKTYYYVVRWIDADGWESFDSNEAGATSSSRR